VTGATGETDSPPVYAVVIPTLGRPSLQRLLGSLAAQRHPPREVVVVDDRRDRTLPLALREQAAEWKPRVVRAGGRGPAAARNLGWRLTSAAWVVFLDDDVELPPEWSQHLAGDLASAAPEEAGSQGRLRVPVPVGRRPTDWERNTAALERAAWATADMAYRRPVLEQVAGFDERFPRAYREDADLALRVRRAGWRLVRGDRVTLHPVRAADGWVSVRVQAGNADDALMRRLHGRGWRRDAQAPPGRLTRHALTVTSGVVAAAAFGLRRQRLGAVAVLCWAGLYADFAGHRVRPGPRLGEPGWAAEWRRMLVTSAVIPFAAVRHRLAGEWRHRGSAQPWPPPVRAVLFDRDGTLVHDVPYNADPERVRPVDGAVEALERLRRAGVKLGLVTNQSGVGRGLLSPAAVRAVNTRVERELGPFDTWQVCLHAPEDGCGCRKPRPGMLLRAARALGVPPEQCAVIGDIGADVEAARAAGARPVLVPTALTREQEIADAPVVAEDLGAAVALLLGSAPAGTQVAVRSPR
jgi:histidinol-phosphate phosphatase family protein